jgi:F-type H+-transporting ATPase subunit a
VSGYTFLQAITTDTETQKLLVAGSIMTVIATTGVLAAAKINSAEKRKAFIAPKRASLTTVFDFIFEAFIKFHDSVAGPQNRRYVSLSVSVFFTILLMNLIGLIPGMVSPTTTVSVNVAIALIVFLSFNYYGIREQGLVNYLKHFAGPVWWLAPLLFPLEILSAVLRVLTLNLRLYWNITADHIVLGVFTELTKYVVPVIFYGLGTFVCFMQAFVFTTLTMVYIFLAVDHGAEEH